jgi:hypothetical protein
MKKLNLNRQLVITLLLTIITCNSMGQNCFCISGTTDKTTGIETVGGVTNSKDFYSLIIQKEIHPNDTISKYILYLNASSRVLLTDSMLKTKGKMTLTLLDSSSLTYENVSYFNNPLFVCCSIGFQVYLTEEQIKVISINPIVSMTVLNSLTTSFKKRRQKEQMKIINCLLKRK